MSDSAHLYLSRLILDMNCRQVWNELAHPYEMHRTLMRAFPQPSGSDVEAKKRFGVLFRADTDEPTGRVIVYVQSHVPPDWSFLSSLSDYLCADVASPNPACKDVAEAYRQLQDAQVLSFRLRANPTKRVGESSGGDNALKGKRVGLVREEEQLQWLIRKGKRCGFEILVKEVRDRSGEVHQIPRVKVCPEGKQKGRKREGGHPREMTQLAVRFDGLLQITNADAFREALAYGIGPAKAFGFGLLSIAPVRV
jgi:CRISPR system Cascade subunit CasE